VNSLRAREFAAISIAVVAAVGVTLIVAALLVRSSARTAALDSLSRQAALTAELQRSTPSQTGLTSLGAFYETQQQRLSILTIPQAALLLPPDAGTSLRAGKAGQRGSSDRVGKALPLRRRPPGAAGRRPAALRHARIAPTFPLSPSYSSSPPLSAQLSP
jgi:hypothetical protein